MRLTVLGSATPYPRPGRPCSGYLIQHESAAVWVDAGSGTLAELQRHIRLDELSAIWISHAHADHTADLLSAYYALRFADIELESPIPLLGPPGLERRLTDFLGSDSPTRLPTVLDVSELGDGGSAGWGALRATWREVRHSTTAFGLRVESPRASIAFSGDTAECDALVALAADVDLLLCEAGDSSRDDPASAVHLTPEEAGLAATRARARGLLLTHVSTEIPPDGARSRAASRFDGPIGFATPGDVVEVGEAHASNGG